MTLITWECDICKDIVVSDTTVKHQMNWCKCGVSACDAEEYYIRWVGKPKPVIEAGVTMDEKGKYKFEVR